MTPFRLHARNSQAAPALISYCAGAVSSSPSTSWQPSNENDIKGHNPLEGLTMNVLEGTGTWSKCRGISAHVNMQVRLIRLPAVVALSAKHAAAESWLDVISPTEMEYPPLKLVAGRYRMRRLAARRPVKKSAYSALTTRFVTLSV